MEACCVKAEYRLCIGVRLLLIARFRYGSMLCEG